MIPTIRLTVQKLVGGAAARLEILIFLADLFPTDDSPEFYEVTRGWRREDGC